MVVVAASLVAAASATAPARSAPVDFFRPSAAFFNPYPNPTLTRTPNPNPNLNPKPAQHMQTKAAAPCALPS